MKKKLSVCLVAPIPPPYGGIGNWVLLLKEYNQKHKKIELNIVDTAPKSRGIDGRTLWERVFIQGMQMLVKQKELKQSIKENRPDVIHITTSGQLAVIRDILLLRTAEKKGIPTVYHIRFGRINDIAQNNTREWKLISKAMLLATVVVAIDNTTYNAIKQNLPTVNVVCIPNPIDILNLPKPIKSNSKTVMFLGWVIKTKGIEELLTAWEQIYKNHCDWSLRIVGPYKNEYLHYLKNSYSSDGVVYEGEKSHEEAMEILNDSEVFVLPSYTEGFPNAILEAMALAKPVIATRVGAIPDMLADECGVLINDKSSCDIKIALNELITDESIRIELSTKAYNKLLNEYKIEIIFNKYMTEWQELCDWGAKKCGQQ